MTATLAPPAPASPTPGAGSFLVALPGFAGTLGELAAALRAGRVPPAEVPLLALTREVLAWAGRVTGEGPAALADAHPELLPTLAAVIALKARLLLPPEEDDLPPEADVDEPPADEVLRGVEALAQLDTLVGFLAARRREREGLIPARPFPVTLPRPERPRNPQGSLARLVRAARTAVRQVEVPLLARDRLTLQDALGALRAFGRRLRTFTFRGIPAQDWGERTTYFAALLEGVKEGTFSAEQAEPYGEIAVTSHLTEGAEG
ncbi:segregation and condensation protein A [Deinococcus arcticus]|uniref:Segregation/condensation protein A n=1 Tax=Deinococcus arcticus TaxID=2136176 RepID=A0A2T3W7T4_9DEIO|nr:ScpA family protein [Deinococcus arcticus]PTA67867.1 segregation/condensation protein A [Deinococcus arcticus]